jgi:hypothetical protein
VETDVADRTGAAAGLKDSGNLFARWWVFCLMMPPASEQEYRGTIEEWKLADGGESGQSFLFQILPPLPP